MKKIKSITTLFSSEEHPYERRILLFICFLGGIATIVALGAQIAEQMPLITISTVIVMFLAIISVLCASIMRINSANKLTIAVVLIIGVLLFPIIYYTNGGENSGIAAYFSLFIMIEFLLLKGKMRVVTLLLTTFVIVFCYFSTLFLDFIALPSVGMNNKQVFIDNIQSIFVAGFFMGLVIMFHKKVYVNETQKAERRLAGQQFMSSISKELQSKAPMDDLIQAALARVGKFMNVERVIVAVFEKKTDFGHPEYYWLSDKKYTPKHTHKEFDAMIKDLFPRFQCNNNGQDSISDEIFISGAASRRQTTGPGICCENALTYDNGYFKNFYQLEGLKSFICTPVYVDGELWGIMGIEDYKSFRNWSESDVQLVSTVSSSISNAVVRDFMDRERSVALEQAIKASRAKGDFLSNMSHEIRTPMNAIIGMTAIGKSSDSPEKKDYAFKKIDEASKHLLGVINDILDMSKIEANKLELSPVNFEFEKMIKKVVDIINFRVDERRQHLFVNIDNNIPRILIGDDVRLAQVITNLLSNAVKFTPEEGKITLSARLVSEEDRICHLQIDVSDTGIGISDEQKKRLFQSFEQAEVGISRKFGGTGLGLAISKNIIKLMGGDIWVESEPCKGSTFSFNILLKRGISEPKRTFAEEAKWKNLRVLAVDDEEGVRDFFADTAKSLNITCDIAASGEEAAEMLQKDTAYDLYFLDWKLPGISGTELAGIINSKSEKKPVIVIFSSVDWDFIEDEARAAGVDKFIVKPLFRSSVVDVINECIGHAENAATGEESEEPDDFSGRAILLAEDVEINREIVAALLEPMHLSIEYAENGLKALEMFKNAPNKFDMIFMDIQMPVLNGFDATRAIRTLDTARAKSIPIIAMTANVFREDVEQCIDAGMNAHIGKPLNFDEVLAVLRKYLD